ncbi:MAG: hypothetical protein VYB00_04320 [Candidatus Thermoplasmatota archaeon]|nr:hypothetical protein [Candidatus Thermoplasmatota archaeon]
MEEYDVNIDHARHSVGGDYGHIFRRLIHVSMALIPVLYYAYGEEISSQLNLAPQEFVSLTCVAILLVEAIRLKSGIVIVGQREYEASQISAMAWGTFAVSIALLMAPTMGRDGIQAGVFGIPIILGLCIVDPVMGEVKRRTSGLRTAILVGGAASYAIWMSCTLYLDTPLIATAILAPLTVIGELPSTNVIDDNATMVLIPLAGAILLNPFL